MTDLTTLRDLYDRLDETTGLKMDRVLALDLAHVLSKGADFTPQWAGDRLLGVFDGSIDAVAALTERLLPGWDVRASHLHHASPQYQCSMWHKDNAMFPLHAGAPTEALARLKALVRALIVRAEQSV